MEDKKSSEEETHRKIVYHEYVEEIDGPAIEGYDFNNGVNYDKIIKSFYTTGFQATHLSKAIGIVNEMINNKAKIFLGYTSNMVSSGLRDIFRYLVEHKKVDVVSTTGGAIEEDIIKCLKPFILGDFHAKKGQELCSKGINRIGNIYVPDDRYVLFEKFLIPILEEIYEKQKETGRIIGPSDLIWKLGEKINDEKSICYWAWKNKIRFYCPTILDGSIGDIIYVFRNKHRDFLLDVVEDTKRLNDSTIGLNKSGVIILGTGVVKHSLLNANLFRNGADYVVYINNAQEFDGSDAGAMPDEAVSWKKIAENGKMIKVFGDATILFPLLVASTFASGN
ncbi:MAG: deoxyhypusine synthase [Nanoarchaeota archaeon]|nr:deoxyhypusine synthase [Nanoarchaeota archaeon]